MWNLSEADGLVAVQALVGSMFIVSGAMKVIDLPAFTTALGRYQILRGKTVAWMARALAGAECVTGLLLFARWPEVVPLLVAVVLIVLASGAVLVQLISGRRVPCGCFGGTDETLVGWWHVLRNVLLLLSLTWAIALRLAGTVNALRWSEWALLFGAAAAFWLGTAQVSVALRLFQRHADT